MLGAIVYNDTYTSTLTEKLTFRQPCDDPTNPSSTNPGASGNSTVVNVRDPFYASTSPQIFAIATATVISYLLVIIIFITPRSINAGGLRGTSNSGFLGRSANTSVVGVGRRPWLQKIATITVAISLTIATADTFRVAQEQYDKGYTDANLLVDNVVGSLEIRIVRVISDTFLWLAQVQTLIRLFPRHKEKVTIKWLGFALVSLDTIFSILDDFVNQSVRTRPRSFQDAIPALAYLFELAISLIYASCVIYYSLSKRRFAFWHNRMPNICLVALLSLASVLIPVVFFVLDVSKPDVAGWGDYIRWVGAAAASVVVWEWVERIEALERDERKDGILGREIFDGDEMLDDAEADLPGRRQHWNRRGSPTDDSGQAEGATRSVRMRGLRSRVPFQARFQGADPRSARGSNVENSSVAVGGDSIAQVAIPAQAATPVSRSDTTSAGSTIYAIRYHTVNAPAVQNPEEITNYVHQHEHQSEAADATQATSDPSSSETANEAVEKDVLPVAPVNLEPRGRYESNEPRSLPLWRTVPNPFKRRRASPPAEVAAQIAESGARRSPADRSVALRDRFASARRTRTGRSVPRDIRDITAMPVTIIPAQPRGHRTLTLDQDGDEGRNQRNAEQEQDGLQQQGQVPNIAAQTVSMATVSENSQNHEMSVLVIPAPRRGQRTWSPEDASTGKVVQSPIASPIQPDPPPEAGSMPSAVLSTRGSLTISEDQVRNPPLRSSYTRSSPVYFRHVGSAASAASMATSVAAISPQVDEIVKGHGQSPASCSGNHNEPGSPLHVQVAQGNNSNNETPDDASTPGKPLDT